MSLKESLHSISGWLSKNRDKNSCMRKISYSQFPPKVRACVNSRCRFWTTNLKLSVAVIVGDEWFRFVVFTHSESSCLLCQLQCPHMMLSTIRHCMYGNKCGYLRSITSSCILPTAVLSSFSASDHTEQLEFFSDHPNFRFVEPSLYQDAREVGSPGARSTGFSS